MAKPLGSQKTGGRQKGTPNKKTLNLEEALLKNNLDVVARISELLPQLNAQSQVEVYLDLMTYLYPKRKSVESISESTVVNVEPELSEEEKKVRLETAKKKALDIARKLILLDERKQKISKINET